MKKQFSLASVHVCLSGLLLGLSLVPGTALAKAHATAKPAEDQQHIDFDLLTDSANGDTAKVLRDLKRGANIEIRDSGYYLTSLMWASWHKHLATVKALLAHGANVNAKAQPPADFSFDLYRSNIVQAGESDQQNSQFDELVAGWSHVNAQPGQRLRHYVHIKSNDSGLTALHFAVAAQSLPEVNSLIKAGADVNAENSCYNSPLDFSGAVASLPIAQTLLKHGASPNPPGPCLQPVLFWAVVGNNPHLIMALLNAGADPTKELAGVLPMSTFAQMMPESHMAPVLRKAEAKWRKDHPVEGTMPAIPSGEPAPPTSDMGPPTLLDDAGQQPLPDTSN